MNQLYVISHQHEYGTTVYLGRCEHTPTEEEVVAAFEIDFEPDNDEGIDIAPVGDEEIKDL